MPIAELLCRLASAEAQLQRVVAESERRDRLATLGTISGMIAHEVNNLMTPVLTYAQLALAHPDDQVLTKKALEHAARGAQSAAKVMSAILALAREGPADVAEDASAAGRHGGPRSTWNTPPKALGRPHASDTCFVAQAIDAAIACLGHEPGRGGVQIRVAVPADIIAPIAHVALQHIVLNLILNARNAIARAGQRGASITICARAGSDELRSDPAEVWSRPWPQRDPIGLVIEVSDTGPGMQRERVLRLFAEHGLAEQPQAPQPRAHSAEGGHAAMSERGRAQTGLGLEICRRLIEQVGGCLAISSAPGAGTRARCVLPRPSTP